MQGIRCARLQSGLFICVLLGLPGCAPTPGQQAPTVEPALLQAIECHSAYRTSVTVPVEREETVMLTSTADEQNITFADLVFHARYWPDEPGGEGPSLRLSVTAAGSADELVATLYQLPAPTPPRNQFSGGHGFTGLSYVYHPASHAELQYWCLAR